MNKETLILIGLVAVIAIGVALSKKQDSLIDFKFNI